MDPSWGRPGSGSASQPGPGSVIANRYRLEAPIGQGGFGVVYRATQLGLERPVALKLLLPDASEGSGRRRFEHEAKLAQRLAHPNTVRLLDFGAGEDGTAFIAWELLVGSSLDALLRAERVLDPRRVARIATQVLKSLMEAHALGIVHRDIKPSNIFVSDVPGEPDFVKVLDFGIAVQQKGPMWSLSLGVPSLGSSKDQRESDGSSSTSSGSVWSLSVSTDPQPNSNMADMIEATSR